jgi:hypothetical protein
MFQRSSNGFKYDGYVCVAIDLDLKCFDDIPGVFEASEELVFSA